MIIIDLLLIYKDERMLIDGMFKVIFKIDFYIYKFIDC